MEIESLELKTEKEYKEFLDYLFLIKDIEYRDFNTKIVVPVDCEIIGIRTPILPIPVSIARCTISCFPSGIRV